MRLDGYALPDWTEPECFDAYKMESDDEWLGFRTKGVGGSDVAAIMGISAYRSPVEVWMEKTGRKQPADLSDKEAVEWGNRLESIIRNKFAEMHPEFIVSESGVTFVSRKRPWAHANLDGMVRDANGDWGVLEIKTVGKNREGDWAEGVPDYYMTQVTHYLMNAEYDIITRRFRETGLVNGIGDKVKVYFIPSYLNGNDGVFNMPYYDLLCGLDQLATQTSAASIKEIRIILARSEFWLQFK